MRATVQVIPPTGNGQHVTLDMLKKALADKKITQGIDEAALQRIVEQKIYIKAVTVAAGDEPVNGVDAQIIYHYDKFLKKQDTSVDSLTHIDYKEISKIISTDADQLLLEKIPPTDGKAGRTILGKAVRQVKGKDLRIRAGKGVRVDETGLKWFSEIAGQVTFRSDQISVENVLELENIDAESGNIHFKGTVVVKGIVEDGFTVESTADVRVMGSVGASRIRAHGTVTIVGGVFGKGSAEVDSSEGSIYVKFAQDARLRAAGTIYVEEYSRNSNLRAGKAIHVVNEHPNRGRILGGSASAMDEIRCNNIGGEMEIPTKIMVGVSKEDIDRMNALEAAIEKRFQAADGLRKSLFLAQRQKQRLGKRFDDHKEDTYQRILTTMASARAAAAADITELAMLYRNAYVHSKCFLHVPHQIFANVEINIQLATLTVKKAISCASLTNNDGEVAILPLMEHR
jgi:uncharacterized protein (DUF342 family)